MATQIDARVKQKTGTAADFAGYTLLEGEIALVRTSANGPVWNFKVGAGNFDSLDWSLQNPGAAQKADTSTVFPVGVPGLYIPTEDGTYEGVTVDLSAGYTQLIWDGSTMTKVEFPISLDGYATVDKVDSLQTVSIEDNLYDHSNANEGQAYSLTTGALVSSANSMSYRLPVGNRRYLVADNGNAFNYVEFSASGSFIGQGKHERTERGFELTPSANATVVGLNLVNDGNFSRDIKIYPIEGFSRTEIGSTFGRLSPSNPLMYIDQDNQGLLVRNPLSDLTDALGGRKYVEYVGENINWDFSGGSLAGDQVSKSTLLQANTNSESYSAGNSYTIDVAATPSSGGLSYLQFDGPGSENSFQFSREVLDFTINRLATSGRISILYAGTTRRSRKLAHGFLFTPLHTSGNGLISIQEKQNIATSSWVLNSSFNTGVTFSTGDECRLIHTFNGRTHTLRVLRLTGGSYVSLGLVTYSYGPCEQRPSNRKFAIELSNIGVTITGFTAFNDEAYRTRLMLIGDSIQSGFACTDFENAYSRKATRWVGIAGSVRSAHGGTTEDFLAMLPEILDRRPEVVVMALGLNDVRNGVPNYQANYQSIVSQLETVESKVILCKLIPNNDDDVTPFNAWLQSTFGSTNTIVDMYAPMEDPSNPGQLNPAYHTDGTHPNDAGSEVMFQTLKPYL